MGLRVQRAERRSRPGRRPLETRQRNAPRQPVSTTHLDDLRAQARYARQRYDLYKARAYGQRSTSPARMRELQRACEQTEARLRAAEAQERLARIAGNSAPEAPDG